MNRPKRIEEILDEQIDTAMREHSRSALNLFLSGIAAGLEIGFSVFLMATVFSMFSGIVHPAVLQTLLAFSYPIGFIFVIIGKSELFTEHTTLAVIPVLNRNATVRSLLILWGVVFAGNLLGGYIFSLILSIFPAELHVIKVESFADLARKLIDHRWIIIVLSGILAGWLMGLLSWLITSAQETISRILLIIMVTSLIGLGGLHHAIVGSIEVFTAMLTSPEVTLADYFKVQVWATLGNIIGGVVFVAFMKYSHVTVWNNRRKRK